MLPHIMCTCQDAHGAVEATTQEIKRFRKHRKVRSDRILNTRKTPIDISLAWELLMSCDNVGPLNPKSFDGYTTQTTRTAKQPRM